MRLQLLAGTALGLLLGLLVGLSSSPVVATVVGALTGGMLVFLGFTSHAQSDSNSPSSLEAAGWRLTGFGLACTVALIIGLVVRTQNLLTLPIKKQVSELTDAGFTADEAHGWVAYKNIGVLMRARPDTPMDKDKRAAGTASSYLFATPSTDYCDLFNPDKYSSQAEHLIALRNAGGRYAVFVASIANLDERSRATALAANKHLFCPE
jgi:hypothetical protein